MGFENFGFYWGLFGLRSRGFLVTIDGKSPNNCWIIYDRLDGKGSIYLDLLSSFGLVQPTNFSSWSYDGNVTRYIQCEFVICIDFMCSCVGRCMVDDLYKLIHALWSKNCDIDVLAFTHKLCFECCVISGNSFPKVLSWDFILLS